MKVERAYTYWCAALFIYRANTNLAIQGAEVTIQNEWGIKWD